MNDNVLQQLGLEDKVGAVRHGGPAPQAPQAQPAAPVGGPVLDLDRWDVQRGEELLRDSPGLRAKLHGVPDQVNAAADLHAVAFKPYPELVEDPSDKPRAEFVKALLEQADTKVLRVGTVLNGLASDIAATRFAEGYAAFLRQLPPEQKKGQPGRQPSEEQGDGQEGGESGGGGPGDGDEQLRQAARAAAESAAAEAAKEVEETEEVAAALGCGRGDGQPGAVSQEQLKKVFHSIRDNPELRKIINLAGRYRRMAQAKQRGKTKHAPDEITGIMRGDKLERLLGSELALLTDPDLELDLLRRLADKEAMLHEVKRPDRVGKGPIVVVVDESGSMRMPVPARRGEKGDPGRKIDHAKAFALAMVWVARHQRRPVVLVSFSDGHRNHGGRYLYLKPGRRDDAALLDWVLKFQSGGTNAKVPLGVLPNEWWPLFAKQGMKPGTVDMILLSDGIVDNVGMYAAQFNEWKKANKVRCIGLMVGVDDSRALKDVLDEVHYTDTLGHDNEQVGRCLAL